MKRGGPPRRRTPLNPGTKRLHRGALNRNAENTRAAAAGKPLTSRLKPVTPEERRARAAVKARSLGVCEMDGRTPATDMHHRQNRSQGGVWSPENLLHLCSSHHQHVTVNPALACGRGWSVRSTQDPAGAPVWLAGRGWSYLDAAGGVTPTAGKAAA